MSRVSRSSIQRHKKLLKHAKGYWGRNKSCYRIAKRVVEHGWQYAYRDRRNKKRDMRGLWIQRINAATRANGLRYGEFMYKLKVSGIELDRKSLAHMAVHNSQAFVSLVSQVR